jgi:3-methyladenine DNA glycosylase AlkD
MKALSHDELLAEISRLLKETGDPERAVQQQRYMKSELPYYGVTLSQLRPMLRPLIRQWQPSLEEWEATVRSLYDAATHREERYAALALARSQRQYLDLDALPLARHLIEEGAWWDLVDEAAQHVLGPIVASYSGEMAPVLREWARDEDLWIRRAAVLSQLGRKEQTDAELLRDVIEANLANESFWLRKAIGWALRQYARTDPNWVRAVLAEWEDRLSPLSRREAAKHLG